jgi:hypothetical protein
VTLVGERKKPGEIVEIVQNQKDGRQIASNRSPLKDLSVFGEVGDLTAVSDGYGKSDAYLPRFFSLSYQNPAIGLITVSPWFFPVFMKRREDSAVAGGDRAIQSGIDSMPGSGGTTGKDHGRRGMSIE